MAGVIDSILSAIGDLVLGAVNALINALGVVISALLSFLPNMPAIPDPPDALVTAESWVAWFFPVSTVIDILTFWLAMWLIWQVIALALRWAKALGED
jgi:hypothetical protein